MTPTQSAQLASAGQSRPASGSSGERAKLIERADAMFERLRARSAEAESTRRIPEQTLAEFREAGFLRLQQPARYGGFELDGTAYLDVCSPIGRGCASSAWVLLNYAAHAHFLAQCDVRVQDEIWGADPDAFVASSYIFVGKATEVDGGYRLTGRWPFSSGINHATWTIVGATVQPSDGGTPENRYFVLPASDYTVQDEWDVVGLKGTGSNDIACEDVFVPGYRTISFDELSTGAGPGLSVNTNPVFRVPTYAVGGFSLLPAIHGAARGAFNDYVGSIKSRRATASGKGLADLQSIQSRIAEADVLLETVELMVRASYNEIQGMADRGEPIDPLAAIRARRNAAHCAQLCVKAVDLIISGSGAAGLFHSSAIQRAWRDVHAGSAQFVLQWDVAGPAAGRVYLGLPSGIAGIK